jgi:hypothetical protein
VADTARMNNNGTSVVYRPVGDTSGICCHTTTTRKNPPKQTKTQYREKRKNHNQIKGDRMKEMKEV